MSQPSDIDLVGENTRLTREVNEERIAYRYLQKQFDEHKASMGKELNKRATRIEVLETSLAKFKGCARWTASDDALLTEGKR